MPKNLETRNNSSQDNEIIKIYTESGEHGEQYIMLTYSSREPSQFITDIFTHYTKANNQKHKNLLVLTIENIINNKESLKTGGEKQNPNKKSHLEQNEEAVAEIFEIFANLEYVDDHKKSQSRPLIDLLADRDYQGKSALGLIIEEAEKENQSDESYFTNLLQTIKEIEIPSINQSPAATSNRSSRKKVLKLLKNF